MTKKQLLVSAVLLAVAVQVPSAATGMAQQPRAPAAAAPAAAQPRPPQSKSAAPAAAGQPAQDAPAADDRGGSAPGEPAAVRRSPVFVITGIEVFQSSLRPSIDVIRVTGLAPSSGWTDPELVTIGGGAPSDGILDLMLAASAPGETADADGFAPLDALLPIEPGHPFKGVRVRSATNAMTLRQIPGHIEGRVPTEDCSSCMGKLFVAKGQSVPAGATEIVKQEDLPPDTVIMKPTDGVTQIAPDPNRLTVILGDDGRIAGVFWN